MVVAGELVAKYLGRARGGERRGFGAAVRQDRGTRLILTVAVYAGFVVASSALRTDDRLQPGEQLRNVAV